MEFSHAYQIIVSYTSKSHTHMLHILNFQLKLGTAEKKRKRYSIGGVCGVACRRCIGIHYIIITLVFAARQLHTETPRVHRRSEELDITLKEIQKRKKKSCYKELYQNTL